MKKLICFKNLFLLLTSLVLFQVSNAFSVMESKKLNFLDPPIIIWTNPSKQYSILKSDKANIKATIKSSSEIISIQLYLNDILYGEPEMSPSTTERGSFIVSKTIVLEPGDNTIYIVVTNEGGSARSDNRYLATSVPTAVKSDYEKANPPTSSPEISWTDPNRLRTNLNSTRAEIRATIKSNSELNSVVLYLNNVLYGEPEMVPSLTETGSFLISKTVNLEPGQDSIYFIATSSTGSTTSEKRYFIVPLSTKIKDSAATYVAVAPSIKWAAPLAKSITLNSASTNIRATIKSVLDLHSVVVYLNGVSQGETEIKPSQTETQSYVLEKTLDFRQVENSIFIEVRNADGTVTRSESRILICPPSSLTASKSINQNVQKNSDKNPENKSIAEKQVESTRSMPSPQLSEQVVLPTSAAPLIVWTSPSGSHTTLESFNATVKANIKSGSGLKSVLLYLNGVSKGPAEIKQTNGESGNYTFEKNINFGPGENTIYLVATNNEGATKSEIRYFSNPEAVAPVITWSKPESLNSLVNEESLTVSACIKSTTELRSVKLLVNGNIQIEDNIFQPSASDDCNYSWKTSVVLREGDNSIFIIAANVAGSSTSEKRVIKLTTMPAEKRLALVIGNSQYKNSAPLKNPVNDANLMEATLKDLGFQVIKRLDVGYNEMKSAIREFEDKLPDNNIALFYYAGHGNQVDGKNYLVPVDARLEKPSDCKFEAIEVNLIVDEFERYQDNTNIVILDACRNNPFASWARGGEAGFRPMIFTSGTIVAYATSMGATAADGKGANGLYTEELVKQMAITQPISSVFMNTRVQVRKLSNNQQVPSEENKLNGEFYFKK